ncbi:MAG: TetR/AcrR family transcriptional regulator [Spirochaetia bacterium]|nr:TetR/AcrR family transcriptional regulator [Spirochaetia bacterium]
MISEVFKKYGPDDISKYGLRDIKFGRARLAILDAFLQSLAKTPYEQILIKDLCRAAEISEPSFYNYFPRKDDLFLYFISLWSVDAQLHCFKDTKGISTIHKVYSYTARQMSRQAVPLMKEIIAYQAKTNVSARVSQIKPVSAAEKILVFGNVPDIEKIPDQGLGPIIRSNLEAAKQSGEISSKVNIEVIGLILGSLFFGIPVLLLHSHPEAIEASFQLTLDYVLKKPF